MISGPRVAAPSTLMTVRPAPAMTQSGTAPQRGDGVRPPKNVAAAHLFRRDDTPSTIKSPTPDRRCSSTQLSPRALHGPTNNPTSKEIQPQLKPGGYGGMTPQPRSAPTLTPAITTGGVIPP